MIYLQWLGLIFIIVIAVAAVYDLIKIEQDPMWDLRRRYNDRG